MICWKERKCEENSLELTENEKNKNYLIIHIGIFPLNRPFTHLIPFYFIFI